MQSIQSLMLGILTLCTAFLSGPAFADPPARAGRITHVNGPVSMYTEHDESWKPAQLNFPITSENSLWTEHDARAEMRIGPNAFRLGEDTVLDFVRIDDERIQALLQRGQLNLRVRQLGKDDEWNIETDQGRLSLQTAGRYHVAYDN